MPVFDHPTRNRLRDTSENAVHNGGEPPQIPPAMEARVAKLEAVVPTLATKMDLAELRTELVRVEGSIRADMHKEFTMQTWRIIGAMLTFGGLLSAAVFFIARNVH